LANKHTGLKLLGAAGAVAAAGGAAYYMLGSKVLGNLLGRAAVAERSWSPEKQLQIGPLEEIIKQDPYFVLRQEGYDWYDAQPVEKVTALSPRGERIHADLLRGHESRMFLISLHGYSCVPTTCGALNQVFAEWGYNILSPFLCGHGESENDYASMGWLDRIDVLAWIDYLNREFDSPPIVLYGASMGGAAVMMTTGEELPANVVCAVEDCGYTSVWDEFVVQSREMFDRGPFPAMSAASMVSKLKLGFSFKEASCVEQVKKSKTPTLFIHGDKDDFVPFWMLDIVYRSAACEKEKLVIPGAGHAECAGKDPDTYFGTIQRFIERHLAQ